MSRFYKPQDKSRRQRDDDPRQMHLDFERRNAMRGSPDAHIYTSLAELQLMRTRAQRALEVASAELALAEDLIAQRKVEIAREQQRALEQQRRAKPRAKQASRRTFGETCGDVLRDVNNRLVKTYANIVGLPYRTAWVHTYVNMDARTGYNAIVASEGYGTHLDKVEEDGKMGDLHETLLVMIKDASQRPLVVP